MRHLFFASLFVLASATSGRAQTTPSLPLARRIGIAWLPAHRSPCATLPDTGLKPGDSLSLLWPPASQVGGSTGRVERAVVTGRVEDCGWISRPGEATYSLEARLQSLVPYLAVLGPVGRITVFGAFIRIDSGADGGTKAVKVCTSMEGVHFTIWAGPRASGTLLYHRYVPLGYDVVPSCTQAEVRDPATAPDST